MAEELKNYVIPLNSTEWSDSTVLTMSPQTPVTVGKSITGLSHVDVFNGTKAWGDNVIFSGNSASWGGAIRNQGGTIIFGDTATFANNSASDGGAIDNGGVFTIGNEATFTGNSADNGSGGAIFNGAGGDYADIGNEAKFEANSASADGGAICTFTDLTIRDNAVFSGNIAGGEGGAISNSSRNVTVIIGKNSSFTGNQASWGGAIYNEGNVSIGDTATFANNSVSFSVGGAIYNNHGSFEIGDNATFANNSVSSSTGGAIYNNREFIIGTGVVFSGNTAENGSGGAIGNTGTLIIGNNAVFNNNRASNSGGAVYNEGTITLGNAVFATASDTIYNDGTIIVNGNVSFAAVLTLNAESSLQNNVNIDLNIAKRTTDAEALISDWSRISGDGTLSITVAADQADGTYKLAQGASGFSGSIAIGTANEAFGAVSVNSDDFVYNNTTYSLDLSDGDLTLTIINPDTTPPEEPIARMSTELLTNTDITVEVIYSADSAVRQYKVGDGEWQDYIESFTVSENNTVYFRAEDAVGNASTSELVISNIDKEKASLEISGNVSDWTTENIVLTVNAEDSGSGIKSIQYSLDNLTWKSGSEVSVTENGTVYFKVTDNAGNVTTDSVEVNKIDTVPPAVPTGVAYEANKQEVMLSWYESLDGKTGSGISGYTVEVASDDNFNNIVKVFDNVPGTEFTIDSLRGGNYFVRIAATDNAGNTSDWSETISFAIKNIARLNDINADGVGDIAMINSDRELGVWLMDPYGGAQWLGLSALPRTWDLFKVTSLNDDEYTDILLYDAANNDVGAWYIDSNGVPEWESLGRLDAGSTLAAACDVNGDSITDLVVRNEDGSVTFKYIHGTGTDTTVSLSNGWQLEATGDFNGDGTDDILFRNDVLTYVWYMNNGEVTTGTLGDVALDSEILGLGDFNGDKTDDLLIKTGNTYEAWLIEDGAVVSVKDLGTYTDADVFEAVIDINGDGIDDLRFRNRNDLRAVEVKTDSAVMKTLGQVPGDWRTAWPKEIGTAVRNDLSGDGIADIVMVNGENYGGAWIMDAKGAPTWLPLSSLPGTWDLWEAKNLNGDQFADILLYDDTNKDIGAWLLNASGVPAWQSLGKLSYDSTLITACDLNGDSLTDLVYRKTDGTVGFRFLESSGTDKEIALSNDWQIAGTGDLNGDGIEDILLRNGTELGAWMMDADANPSWRSVGSIDTAYTVATVADFNGDGTDDILFNSNGSYGAWMMDNGAASAWRTFDGISSTAVLESTGDYNGDGIDDLRFRDGNTLAVYRVYEDSTRWQVIGDVPSNWRTDLGGLA